LKAIRRTVYIAFAALVVLTPPACGVTLVASNGNGDGVVLEQVLNQRTRSLFATTRAADGQFGPLRAISRPSYVDGQSVGVDDGGGAVAAWQRVDGEDGPYDVMVAIKRPGARFGKPRRLGSAHRLDQVRLAVHRGGDALVAWTNAAGVTRYSVRPAGRAFGPPAVIPRAHGRVALALDGGGGLFVLWSTFDQQTKTTTLLSEYKPPGGSFGPPSQVEGPPPDLGVTDTLLTTDRGGNALVAWRAGGTIRVASRGAGEEALGTPRTVATGLHGADTVEDVALSRSGRAALVYGSAAARWLVSRDGGTWAPPERIPAGRYTERARLAFDDRGDFALVWAVLVYRSVYEMYRPAGGALRPLRQLARPRLFAPGGTFVRPSVTIDGRGRATASWEESNGAFVSIYTRDFGAGGIRPRKVVARLRSFRREDPASGCLPSWGRVVRRSHRLSVVVDRSGYYYACLFARGAFESLFVDQGLFPPVELAGPLVAYATDYCDPDQCWTQILTADTRDLADGVDRGWTSGLAEVPAIRLRANGALAWVSCASRDLTAGRINSCKRGTRKVKRVYVLASRAWKPRLADASRRIDPLSLALHGQRLTWRAGRKVRSTRLR
jgi:hypothetical protein